MAFYLRLWSSVKCDAKIRSFQNHPYHRVPPWHEHILSLVNNYIYLQKFQKFSYSFNTFNAPLMHLFGHLVLFSLNLKATYTKMSFTSNQGILHIRKLMIKEDLQPKIISFETLIAYVMLRFLPLLNVKYCSLFIMFIPPWKY